MTGCIYLLFFAVVDTLRISWFSCTSCLIKFRNGFYLVSKFGSNIADQKVCTLDPALPQPLFHIARQTIEWVPLHSDCLLAWNWCGSSLHAHLLATVHQTNCLLARYNECTRDFAHTDSFDLSAVGRSKTKKKIVSCTIFPKCLRNRSERSFQSECFLNLKSFVIGEMFHFRILSRQDVNSLYKKIVKL